MDSVADWYHQLHLCRYVTGSTCFFASLRMGELQIGFPGVPFLSSRASFYTTSMYKLI